MVAADPRESVNLPHPHSLLSGKMIPGECKTGQIPTANREFVEVHPACQGNPARHWSSKEMSFEAEQREELAAPPHGHTARHWDLGSAVAIPSPEKVGSESGE